MAKKLVSWDEVLEALPAVVQALLDGRYDSRYAEKSVETSKLNQAQVDARVQAGINALVGAAPQVLDTLYELARAIGNDPNFATTVTNSIAALRSDMNSSIATLRSDMNSGLAGKANTTHTHTRAQISDATTTGRNLMAASSAADARSIIGAGTSSLSIGTGSGNAMAGNRLQLTSTLPSSPVSGVLYLLPEE